MLFSMKRPLKKILIGRKGSKHSQADDNPLYFSEIGYLTFYLTHKLKTCKRCFENKRICFFNSSKSLL